MNTAWHLAAQGVDTQLRAAVGKDRLGKMILHSLATESKVRDSTMTIIETEEATASCITMYGNRMVRRTSDRHFDEMYLLWSPQR